MERTITYEGVIWQVLVNPAPHGQDAVSGLELVFTDPAGGRSLAAPIDKPLLRTLSREGLELDEDLLRAELRLALERRGEAEGEARPGGAHGE